MNEQYVREINGYKIKDEEAIRTYENVSSMKNDTKLTEGMYVKTRGYYSSDDFGQGEYIIVNDNTLISDNGSVHDLINGLKAVLITDNILNIKQFGAKGDRETNDTTAIQNAINYAIINNIKLIINEGYFRVSTLLVDNTINMEGVSASKSIIESIDNNTTVTANEGLLNVKNNGMRMSSFSNFSVYGNKENQSRVFDGIYCYSSTDFDTYTKIENIHVRYCSGNGITLGGSVGGYTLRENRLNNLFLNSNDLHGLNVTSSTDSFFNNISSSSNKLCGFNFYYGGSHKISNCKAFWNGAGINELETERIPDEAYTETSDTEYVSGTTYYTRSGNGTWYNPYTFTRFNGSEFAQDTTYYELNGTYYKKYSGFSFFHCQSMGVSNCEAQDNQGDGFYISNSNDFAMTSLIGDNNGLLIVNNEIVSYASQSLYQLYCGVFIYKSNYININGEFRNFRNSSVGKSQKAGVGNWQSGYINVNIVEQQQVEDYFRHNPSQKTQNVVINGHTLEEYWNLTDCVIAEGYQVYSPRENNPTAFDQSYLKKVGNTVYYRIILMKSDSSNIPDSDINAIIKVPGAWNPDSIRNAYAFLSQNHGLNNDGVVGCVIDRSGSVNYKYNSNATASKYLVIDGCYTLSY